MMRPFVDASGAGPVGGDAGGEGVGDAQSGVQTRLRPEFFAL